MILLPISLVLLAGFDHRLFGGEVGVLSISFQEIAAGFVLYMLGLHSLVRRRSGTESRPIRTLSTTMVALYCVWLFAGGAANQVLFGNSASLHGLKDSLPGLVLFAALVTWVDTPTGLHRVHVAILVMVMLLALVNLSQYLWGWPYWNPVDPNAYMKHSIGGSELVTHPVVAGAGSPNACAMFFAPLSALTIGWMAAGWHTATIGRRVWGILGCILILGGLGLTQAKAVFTIAALGSVGAVALTTRRVRPTAARASLGFLLAITFGALLLLAVATLGLNHRVPVDLSTLLERLYLSQVGINLLLDDRSMLVLGGGVAAVAEASGRWLGVHNEYLRQCLQGGIPAGGLFLAILTSVATLRVGWPYIMPVLVMAVAFLVEAAVGNKLQSSIYLTLGMAVAAAGIHRQEERAGE